MFAPLPPPPYSYFYIFQYYFCLNSNWILSYIITACFCFAFFQLLLLELLLLLSSSASSASFCWFLLAEIFLCHRLNCLVIEHQNSANILCLPKKFQKLKFQVSFSFLLSDADLPPLPPCPTFNCVSFFTYAAGAWQAEKRGCPHQVLPARWLP